jgi:hypothetical protein
MIHYNGMVTDSGTSVVTFVGHDGVPRTITDESRFYCDVVSDLQNGLDPSDWLDEETEAFDDERVEYRDGAFRFEGEQMPENINEVIARYQREGRDTANLVRFMERLSKNPSFRSREQLFTWTQSKEMVIDEDGYIIGYKGVTSDMLSVHSGKAEVDGLEVVGQIPNAVGTVISMPRHLVQDDPNQGCSHGLHVGNFSYANSFGQILLEVRVDPADVVSVPSDCSFQKLRTCRYEVVAVHESGEDDISDAYEPEANLPDQEDFDAFMDAVPPTFLSALKDRFATRFGRKNKDAED